MFHLKVCWLFTPTISNFYHSLSAYLIPRARETLYTALMNTFSYDWADWASQRKLWKTRSMRFPFFVVSKFSESTLLQSLIKPVELLSLLHIQITYYIYCTTYIDNKSSSHSDITIHSQIVWQKNSVLRSQRALYLKRHFDTWSLSREKNQYISHWILYYIFYSTNVGKCYKIKILL